MAGMELPTILFALIVVLYILRERELRPRSRSGCEIGSASTFGTRTVQQDYSGAKDLSGALLLLLADGNGQNGDIAAKLAVDTFKDLFIDQNTVGKPQYFFKRAANAAHKRITNMIEEGQGESSLASVVLNGASMTYMLVGDCKITIFRGGDLIPVSEGQTIDVLARHRYDEGRISKQETLALLDKHRRYNVFGQDTFHDVELFSKPLELKRNDLIVLMSRGVFNTLRWVDIEDVLSKKKSVQELAKEIIRRVDASPIADKDNASIVICRWNEG
ncbi:MAG: protein phosphatase 2C domain-containing protein [Selenomonadaceae bacterium]|nr:protein phosphatase 2C domain-containing protein [Selenomonadaceae bacterium]